MISIWALAFGFFASAESGCVNVQTPMVTAGQLQQQVQVWCRHRVGEQQDLIFNQNSPSLETSFLLDNESGRVSYGYRLKGQVKLDSVNSNEFNPIPPRVFAAIQNVKAVATKSSNLDSIVHQLRQRSAEKARIQTVLRVRGGTYKAYTDDSVLPWRGYWWPTARLEMARGADSPMALWDQIMRAKNPDKTFNAYDWERANHNSRTGWAGHCHAWAAASIMSPEPKNYKKDAAVDSLISPLTQKGWLTAGHYCMENAFYGRRWRERGDDSSDIAPDRFHKILIHYIKGQGKPVIFDIDREEPVYNHVVSGYRFHIESRGSSRYRVTARLRMHSYDERKTSEPGVARTYYRTFKYDLRIRNGRVVSGRWRSRNNPDFIWVPLKATNCEGQNPYVKNQDVLDQLTQMEIVQQ